MSGTPKGRRRTTSRLFHKFIEDLLLMRPAGNLVSLTKALPRHRCTCMCEKKNRIYTSLYKQKRTSIYISACERKKRMYISLSLRAKKSVRFDPCLREKNESIPLSTSKKGHQFLSLCVRKKTNLYLFRSMSKKNRIYISLHLRAKKKFVSLLRQSDYT